MSPPANITSGSRSELVALDGGELSVADDGLEITIRRSKTDQAWDARSASPTVAARAPAPSGCERRPDALGRLTCPPKPDTPPEHVAAELAVAHFHPHPRPRLPHVTAATPCEKRVRGSVVRHAHADPQRRALYSCTRAASDSVTLAGQPFSDPSDAGCAWKSSRHSATATSEVKAIVVAATPGAPWSRR